MTDPKKPSRETLARREQLRDQMAELVRGINTDPARRKPLDDKKRGQQ